MSDLEKLEAALVSRIYDDFIGGTDIRAVVVDENIFYIIQKAARLHMQTLKSGVDDRTCTCHPDEAPQPCQKKYALQDCTTTPVDGDKIREFTDEELLAYGYAAGNYSNQCWTCAKQFHNLDKRCRRCRECAIKVATELTLGNSASGEAV